MTAPALPIVVAEFDRNSRERIRITLDSYMGKNTIDVRCWYRDGGELKPTKTGITTSIQNLASLAAGLKLALDRARDLGLISDG